MQNLINSMANWLATAFSFKTILTIALVLMFIAGVFFGATLERLF